MKTCRPWSSRAGRKLNDRKSKYCERQGKLAILSVMFERRPTPPPARWAIYKVAAKAKPLGEVEAPDADAARANAAERFRVPATRLIAVFRGQASDGS
jgi:hypothetical protein